MYKSKSASPAYFLAFSTPIFSTVSSVLRIPAVSITFKAMPSSLICSSRTSRVVPAMSVTIAFSSPDKTFKKEDLPAFGFPKITVLIPSFKNLPSLDEEISLSVSFIRLSIFSESLSG